MLRLLPLLLVPLVAKAADPEPESLRQPDRAGLDESTYAQLTVVDGSVTAGPGRETGDVLLLVRQKEPYLTSCLARALEDRTVPEGRLDVAFVVTPAGTVLDARVTGGDVTDAELTACVLGQLRGTSFGFSVVPRNAPVVLALQVSRPFASDAPVARPAVDFGPPRIVGRLDLDALTESLAPLRPSLEACHRKSLEEHGAARSTTDVRFLVDRTGSVSGVIASATGDPWLTECTRKAFESLRLPRSDSRGRTVVRQPVIFGTPGP